MSRFDHSGGVKVIVRDLPAPDPDEDEPDAEVVVPDAILLPANQPAQDRNAFMKWVSDNWGQYIRWKLHQRQGVAEESTEDLFQDLLIVVWQQHEKGEKVKNVTRYLDRLVDNQMGSHVQLARLKHVDHEADADLEAAGGHGPESAAELSQQVQLLRGYVAHLAPEEREVFEARELDGLTLEQTAEKLRRPLSTVAKQQARAMTKLEELADADRNHRRRAG